MKPGRPLLWDSEKIARVDQEMREYTDETGLPMLAEFAFEYGYNRTQLYEYPDLSDAIKRMMDKKEFQLQKMVLLGKCPPAFAIFSLKQLGWRDKPKEEDAEGNMDALRDLLEKVVG